MKIFIIAFLALIGLPFLGVGLWEVFESVGELGESAQTVGTVTGNSYSEMNHDGNVSGAFHPRVEFTDGRGGKIRFTDGIGSLPPDYEAGAQVPVVYRSETPEKARIYSWKRFWLAPTIFIVVGLLPLSVGLVLIRRLNL